MHLHYHMMQNFGRRKFWGMWQITSDLPKFSCPKFLLQIIRNMHETVWMKFLKYFQLKTTHQQSLSDPNRELSSKISSSAISSANTCVGKLLDPVMLTGVHMQFYHQCRSSRLERKLLKEGQPQRCIIMSRTILIVN